MTQTTRQKLAADPYVRRLIDEMPDPVKLSPGTDAAEDYPVLHGCWHTPMTSPLALTTRQKIDAAPHWGYLIDESAEVIRWRAKAPGTIELEVAAGESDQA